MKEVLIYSTTTISIYTYRGYIIVRDFCFKVLDQDGQIQHYADTMEWAKQYIDNIICIIEGK